MISSSIPFIFLSITAFWIWAALEARRRGDIATVHVRAIFVWLAVLAAWGGVTATLALRGGYRSTSFYQWWPGLWVPLMPVMISIMLLAGWPTFRMAAWVVTRTTSPRAFLFVQSIRIAAIGGIFKAMHGLLPASFVYPVGIPDFAYGLLSLVLAVTYGRNGYGARTLIGWNLLGMTVLSSAPVLMQLGLPGPVHVLRAAPDARALFEFPMVLAPTLVVTWLFFINGWHALVLWVTVRSAPAKEAAAGTFGPNAS